MGGPGSRRDAVKCWLKRASNDGSVVNETNGIDAMTATEQALIDKIKQLPPQRLAEVEDFVDFLRTREGDQRLTRAAAKASETSFAAVWDNDEDAVYDRI